MPERLSDNENKEGLGVLGGLQAANFVLLGFDQWLRGKAFQVHNTKGAINTWKGSYGYVQYEFAFKLGGESKVENCWYIPYSDKSKAYPLVKEGISISGTSLSKKDLRLLKQYRYQQVEHTVKYIIEQQIGQRPEPQIKLLDDLGLNEELDIPEIVMQLEDEFDCIIGDDNAKRFKTVEDIISFIRKTKGMST